MCSTSRTIDWLNDFNTYNRPANQRFPIPLVSYPGVGIGTGSFIADNVKNKWFPASKQTRLSVLDEGVFKVSPPIAWEGSFLRGETLITCFQCAQNLPFPLARVGGRAAPSLAVCRRILPTPSRESLRRPRSNAEQPLGGPGLCA